jgi:Phytanoyl-CoA dioxygenase (PhyH)
MFPGMNATDLVRTGLLDDAQTDALRSFADEVEEWPTGSHVWGHYAERTADGPRICRTENVSTCHLGIAALVAGPLRSCAAAAIGEPVTAFKDKLNYKQPGGAGFRPHQDKVAYPGVERVMSILVAIDDCNIASGCLWMSGDVHDVLPVDDRGVVRADVVEALEWTAVELASGDAVCIDGLAPHYSETNRGDVPRRVLVASYAPTIEHYTRAHYYAQRSQRMRDETRRDGRFRISTLADFDGAEVATDAATDHCTHA